jgi:hypothetical protein
MSITFTPEQAERYRAAMHAMQTGVAMDHGSGSDDGSPKHLRVGVNSILIETSVLTNLLVGKGVFTGEEFAEALAVAAEEEKARYEKRLEEKLGYPVHLA